MLRLEVRDFEELGIRRVTETRLIITGQNVDWHADAGNNQALCS